MTTTRLIGSGANRLALVAILLSGSSCSATSAPDAPKPRTVEFNPEEYESYRGSGEASISGQAFARLINGEVRAASGLEVTLRPLTAYSEEWYLRDALVQRRRRRGYLIRDLLQEPDPREAEYTRTVIADKEGRFRFSGLPAGTYLITCWLVWYRPLASSSLLAEEGGWVSATIELSAQEIAEDVIVTSTPRIYREDGSVEVNPLWLVAQAAAQEQQKVRQEQVSEKWEDLKWK